MDQFSGGTSVKNDDSLIPANLEKGSKVLTVTVKYDNDPFCPELDVIDDELKERGFVVDHFLNPSHRELIAKASDYERIFLNLAIAPHSCMGTIRLTGKLCMVFWRAFWVDAKNVIFTSLGSPYHLFESPHWPNMVLAYGSSGVSQKAAVKAWLGEMPICGECPVKLPS